MCFWKIIFFDIFNSNSDQKVYVRLVSTRENYELEYIYWL